VVAYSNYGASLAGEIVAEVSGESFEQYVANHILQPLEMTHSTFLQPLPSELLRDAATGYDVDENGLPHAGSFEFVQAQPAGAFSATATDVAHFMIAHLQDGQFGNERILQPSSAQDMRRQYYAFNPQLPGMTRGFAEAYRNSIHFVFHPGTTERSASLLALLPDQNLGIFMTFNSYISTPPRLALLNAVLDHYYPVSAPIVTPPTDFAQRAARFTGSYIMSRRAETNIDKLVAPISSEVSVVSNPDNTLSVEQFRDGNGTPIRWVEISPLVFQEVGGQRLLAFRTDTQGRVTAMFSGDQPILLFQKLAWYENPQYQLAGLGLALLIFVLTIVLWLSGGLLRLVRRKAISFTRLERWGRYLAGGLILLNLIIVAFIVSVLAGDDSAMQLGYPAGFSIASILALVSVLGTVVLLACVIGAWRQRAWGIAGRLHYTLVAAAAFFFLWYLNQVNLLF
jgi:hypothetical protein